MLGVLLEFERLIMVAHVHAGLARARPQGKVLGRPSVKRSVERRIRELRSRGWGMTKITQAP